jgi:hypothetical protein
MIAMDEAITKACDELKDILLAKNKAYGNSAADPVRIFSDAGPLDQLHIRMDDKLSRLMRGETYANEDTKMDLAGYLLLERAIILRNTED